MSRRPASSRKTFNATEAKNRFGVILKSVSHAPVFIEKHGRVYAVILDIQSYEELMHKARSPEDVQLDELRAEFESMYARMQTPGFRKTANALSATSAAELNAIASRTPKKHA